MAYKRKINGSKSIAEEILTGIMYLIVIVILTSTIITYVGQRTLVSGSSMEPMFQDGDNLIIDKLSYRFNAPERYDIIVFPYKYQEDVYYIKRIIGMPGDTIQVHDGEVYINDFLLEESFGNEPMETAGLASEPILLGDNEYFVLGDNRNHSSDSRDPGVGILTKKDIIGKAWVRIWPISSIGVIRHD